MKNDIFFCDTTVNYPSTVNSTEVMFVHYTFNKSAMGQFIRLSGSKTYKFNGTFSSPNPSVDVSVGIGSLGTHHISHDVSVKIKVVGKKEAT
jgi:hypothetical protein